ncbi:hypothetical protein BJ138DRAFT_1194533 [Hygrophoropsis aurantiaca]|uniref:Uncharacterized protein n=1 Tax=Hygrophoropsis aurantiaca TaxID=72124 RepID=A0ACB7ZRQ3_9AGAM|nr:hypothetical protein BJ138DRAFT_1194533 [Hygrophoropsis aurantiaca]
MKIPFSFLVFLWMLGFLNSYIVASLQAVFSPLCFIPGISGSTLCTPRIYNTSPTTVKWPDFPGLMEVQTSTLGQLLDESVGGPGLSREVTKAEMATRDLAVLVRNSGLKSSDILADLLTTFAKDAKSTARGLTRLSSKVGGAVDEVMAVNGYAMRTIQEARSNTPSRHSLTAFFPFRDLGTQKIIIEAFTDAMDTLSRGIERLILEAEVSLVNLDKLDEGLSAIHEIVTRDDQHEIVEKDKLLAELWTRLGGNKQAVGHQNRRLKLLQDLGEYRKCALAYVVGAIHALQSMSDDLEDLRERVAAPEVLGGRVPLDVHIASIQHGLEKLKERRIGSQ